MIISHFFDLIPIWILFAGTVLLMALFIEFGFRLGSKARASAKKAQTSQVRAIMGAALGLLAFTLAFTFGAGQSHYESRVQDLAEEARIARIAFMQAGLLEEPRRTRAKNLLKDYVELRPDSRDPNDKPTQVRLAELLEKAEEYQRELWLLAVAATTNDESHSPVVQNDAFTNSVLALIDVHYKRLHSAVMNRIAPTVWITIYLMAVLSMIIMGYQAGLTERRSPIATLTLAVAFSSVIVLIVDLDRPVMSFFKVNDQLLVELYEQMEEELLLETQVRDSQYP